MIDKIVNFDIFTILLLSWTILTIILLAMRAKGIWNEVSEESAQEFVDSLDRKDQIVVDGQVYDPNTKPPRGDGIGGGR